MYLTVFVRLTPPLRRHEGGFGLGLAIVRHLVEAHGGAVRADSRGATKGATFNVMLPAKPAMPGESSFRPPQGRRRPPSDLPESGGSRFWSSMMIRTRDSSSGDNWTAYRRSSALPVQLRKPFTSSLVFNPTCSCATLRCPEGRL